MLLNELLGSEILQQWYCIVSLYWLHTELNSFETCLKLTVVSVRSHP